MSIEAVAGALGQIQQRFDKIRAQQQQAQFQLAELQRLAPDGFIVEGKAGPFGPEPRMKYVGMNDPKVQAKLQIAEQERQQNLADRMALARLTSRLGREADAERMAEANRMRVELEASRALHEGVSNIIQRLGAGVTENTIIQEGGLGALAGLAAQAGGESPTVEVLRARNPKIADLIIPSAASAPGGVPVPPTAPEVGAQASTPTPVPTTRAEETGQASPYGDDIFDAPVFQRALQETVENLGLPADNPAVQKAALVKGYRVLGYNESAAMGLAQDVLDERVAGGERRLKARAIRAEEARQIMGGAAEAALQQIAQLPRRDSMGFGTTTPVKGYITTERGARPANPGETPDVYQLTLERSDLRGDNLPLGALLDVVHSQIDPETPLEEQRALLQKGFRGLPSLSTAVIDAVRDMGGRTVDGVLVFHPRTARYRDHRVFVGQPSKKTIASVIRGTPPSQIMTSSGLRRLAQAWNYVTSGDPVTGFKIIPKGTAPRKHAEMARAAAVPLR